MADILQRYADRILGVLSCYDRVIIHGRIPEIAYAKGMEMYLRTHGVRLFDFPKFAQPLRDEIPRPRCELDTKTSYRYPVSGGRTTSQVKGQGT